MSRLITRITTDPTFNPNNYGPFGPPETRAGAPRLPTLTLTSPLPNEEFTTTSAIPMSVEIGVITRTITKVEYFNGTTKIGQAMTSPFNSSWVNPPEGTHSIIAWVVDDVLDRFRSAGTGGLLLSPCGWNGTTTSLDPTSFPSLSSVQIVFLERSRITEPAVSAAIDQPV